MVPNRATSRHPLLLTLARALSLLRQVLLPLPDASPARYLRRVVVTLPLLVALLCLQCLHWVGFLLDEILFRGYRRVAVREPVFVLGVPRSGTTYLHRLLASDAGFTTLTLWECVFAPSIAERYLWRGIGALDRRLGAPLARLVGWLENRLLGALDGVHPTRLADPEEDYFVFMPLLCCFILVVPFPRSPWLWRMARFDDAVAPDERRRLLDWYHRCLQKHLFVHGPHRRMLCKNAAFAGMAQGLAERFEDSVLVLCERDAAQVVGSQFNALAAGLGLFGVPPDDAHFRNELLDCLQFYYENLDRVRQRLPGHRALRVPARDLAQRPLQTLDYICAALGRALPAATAADLERRERGGRRHRPLAQPPLSRWGLDEITIRERFGAWCHPGGRL